MSLPINIAKKKKCRIFNEIDNTLKVQTAYCVKKDMDRSLHTVCLSCLPLGSKISQKKAETKFHVTIQ